MSIRVLFLASCVFSAAAFGNSLKLEVLCQYLKGSGESREQVNVSVLTDLETSEKVATIYSRFFGKEVESSMIPISRNDDSKYRVYESKEAQLKVKVHHTQETTGVHQGFLSLELEERTFEGEPVKCAVIR